MPFVRHVSALLWGALIGTLGGLIGLGGAEFRLPLLVGVFRFRNLQAIVINLVVSLVTVVFSFIFRTGLVNLGRVIAHGSVILNILAGSLIGSYLGVHFATKIKEEALSKIVVVLLVFLSAVLIGHDFIFHEQSLALPSPVKVSLGFLAGIVIGVFSSMLGVAGGELIIPTIIILFGVDIKLAGSLSLAVSVPTIIMGIIRYAQLGRVSAVWQEARFVSLMSVGLVVGALAGSFLLAYAPGSVLQVLLGLILLASAYKLSRKNKAGA